jgi:hypothetical protein
MTGGGVLADVHKGVSQTPEDIAIAALVMSPFALTFGVWLGWLTWAPNWILIVVALAVQVVATLWNAGWRASEDG